MEFWVFGAVYFLKNIKKINGLRIFRNYRNFVFDGITGLSFGPLFYNQPFIEALTGQNPIYLMAFIGKCFFFAIVLVLKACINLLLLIKI